MSERGVMETEFTGVDEVAVRQRSRASGSTKGTRNGATNANSNNQRTANASEFTPRAVTAVIILNVINLLNYADRTTLAAVMVQLQEFFEINYTETSIFAVVFFVSYMLLAPLFGYLGDRYNRKLIMIVGIVLWSLATFGGSFAQQYGEFLFWRAAVGIGEASYATIAPTIIADLFTDKRRSMMLTAFYVAIPVGSGIGYGLGKLALKLSDDDWRWAFRVTPVGGIVCCLLLLFLLQEPKRGEVEGLVEEKRTNSYADELKQLARNKTFVYVTLGFTTITFGVGALQFWAPMCIDYATWVSGRRPNWESFYFMAAVIVGGLGGTAIGTGWATRWKRTNPGAEAHVCAIGSLVAGPLMFFALWAADGILALFWVLLPIIMIMLCLNWAIVVDVVTSVVAPNSRSTAVAVQTLFSHLLGDAFSPVLIGLLADAVMPDPTSYFGSFVGLQHALYIVCFSSVLGGGFFLQASIFLPEDKRKVVMRGKLEGVVKDFVDAHEEERRREEERYQSRLYREKTAAAAARGQKGGSEANHREAVLMTYVKKTSVANMGYIRDVDEEEEEEQFGEGVGKAKTSKRMRPVTEI